MDKNVKKEKKKTHLGRPVLNVHDFPKDMFLDQHAFKSWNYFPIN